MDTQINPDMDDRRAAYKMRPTGSYDKDTNVRLYGIQLNNAGATLIQ